MPQADYEYDTDEDCFIVFDECGVEFCRTASPHVSRDKDLASAIAEALTEGRLIFPTTGDTAKP